MYRAKLASSRVEKELDRIPSSHFGKVDAVILSLQENPRPRGAKKLGKDKYRVRVGNYRVLYWVDDKHKIVVIAKVKHRRESYR